MAIISLRCKHCGGFLEVNDSRDVTFCPYCGSKKLIVESDPVKIQRLKSDAYREVEHHRIHSDETREYIREREKTKRETFEDRMAFWEMVLLGGLALLFFIIAVFII